LLRHARAGELWFLKQQPGPAAKPSKGKGAPKSSSEEDLAHDEENALKSFALSVSDACLRCVRALDPPPDPDPCPASALKKQQLRLETRASAFSHFRRNAFPDARARVFSFLFARARAFASVRRSLPPPYSTLAGPARVPSRARRL